MVETFSDKIYNRIIFPTQDWWAGLKKSQKLWIVLSTLAIFLLGIISKDTPLNIAIGTIGMFYVSVYSTGARGSFLLGIIYVSLYSFICISNKVYLDALQNIVLIPIYVLSFIHWGKENVKPSNLNNKQTISIAISMVVVLVSLYYLSRVLGGNYSMLDSLNTTCTLYAMLLGYFGASLNWAFWSINNVASAVIFGLALATPTGSIAVFAMKLIFVINGFIGWYNFYKLGKDN